MKSLNENHTYDLVKPPKGKKVLKNKWIYRLKAKNNSQQQYKVRKVMKGFGQKKCVDFKEIFSLVVKISSIYMEQLEGFIVKGKEERMCKLKKNLYGLKQAPRQ